MTKDIPTADVIRVIIEHFSEGALVKHNHYLMPFLSSDAYTYSTLSDSIDKMFTETFGSRIKTERPDD